MSKNPNNCETCDYKRMHHENKDKYHCYMFADSPTERCMQHRSEQAQWGTVVPPINPMLREHIERYMNGGDIVSAIAAVQNAVKEKNEKNVKVPERGTPVLKVVK